MDFSIDSKQLKGKDIVVYEYLYDEKENEVAKHEEITDEGQTIHFSQDKTIRISTTARSMDPKRVRWVSVPSRIQFITRTLKRENRV